MSYSSVLLPQLEREDSAIFVDESEKTWIASIMTLTLMIGSIVAGPLMDAFGRKFVNILTAIPYILGWTVQACAVEVWHIYVARLLAGLGGGLTTASTVYVSEITHHHFRPMLLSLTSVFTSIGILLTCLIGMSINWRTMSIIFCLMAIVSMLLIFLTPKSPPWLLTFRDDYEGAEVATRWLYTNLEIFHWQFHLFKSHKSKLHEEILQKPFRERLLGVWRTYRRPEVIKPTIILFFLFVFQQLSGGYVIIFYAVYLFDKLEGNSSATLDEYLALVLLGAIRFVMSFISAILSKYIGRRPLLITSAFGMSVSSLICGLYLYKTHLKGNYNTYYALACILTYICFCALGFLVIPWTLLCEVLPLKVRGTLSGLLMAIAYLLMFGVVKIFLFILNSYKIHSIFFAISLLNLIAVGFVYLWIPETLKKTLGEIEDHFRKSSY